MNNDDLDLGATLRGIATGQHVFNRYVLTRQLGRGGMGIVWLAHDEKLDTDVALKFLPEVLSSDAAAIADLKRETRRALQLTHPNIVRIYDFVEDARMAAVSMEFVDGASLTQMRLEKPEQVFEVEELKPWIKQLCEALSYAHGKAKIAHRDLKPANLMINMDGDLKIADFGISATISDSTTRASHNVNSSSGTPVYMSPQQMMGDRPAPTDDIYSLGATLYELLTGKPPFYSGNIPMQVQNKTALSIAERRAEFEIHGAEIPANWEDAIAVCLSKDSAARPQNAGELANRLALGGTYEPSPACLGVDTKGKTAASPHSGAKNTYQSAQKPSGSFVRKHKWLIIAGSAALACVVFWQADVVNRLNARSAYREAIAPGVVDGSLDAISDMRQAVNLRPNVEQYSAHYNQQQNIFLGNLKKQLADMSPKEAYDHVQSVRQSIIPIFDEPHVSQFENVNTEAVERLKNWVIAGLYNATNSAASGKFNEAFSDIDRVECGKEFYPGFAQTVDNVRASQVRWGMKTSEALSAKRDYDGALAELSKVEKHSILVPEYVSTLSRIRDDQVRYEISLALKLSEDNNFEGALAKIDEAAKRGVLSDAVKTARSQVVNRSRLVCIEELSGALQRRDVNRAQSVIDRLSLLTGRKFQTRAIDLDKETNLSVFVGKLEELGVRQPDRSDMHFDLVLIKALANKFSDKTAVRNFLSGEYTKWSSSLANSKMPGCALYLLTLASEEKGAANNALTAKYLSQAAVALGVSVRFERPESADASLSAYASTLQETLKNNLLKNCSSWVGQSSFSRNGTISISLNLSKVDSRHEKSESSNSVRYQSGTRTVDNPEYRNAESNLRSAESNYQQASAENSRASSACAGATGNNAIIASCNAITASTNLIAAAARLSRARDAVNETPSTISEPVYDNEHYQIIDHSLYHSMSATVGFTLDGKAVSQPLSWNASKEENAREVNGNASHGVPVVKLRLMDRKTIADTLVAQLNMALESDEIKTSFTEALYRQASHKTETGNLNGLAKTDLIWSLRELLVRSGYEFPNEEEIRAQMREQLGLPSKDI